MACSAVACPGARLAINPAHAALHCVVTTVLLHPGPESALTERLNLPAMISASSASAQTSASVKAPATVEALLDSILRRADAQYAREDWPAARDFLSLAAEVAPDNPQVLGALGSLHYKLKDYPAAGASFTAALRQSPDDPDLRIQMAMVQIQLGCSSDAEASLRQALGLRPDDITALKLLADCYRDQGLHEDAAAIYESLVDRHPDRMGVLLCLANCFLGLGNTKGAQGALDQVLKIDPTNNTARENLALLQSRAIKKSPAIRIRVVQTIEEFKRHFGLSHDGVLLETDLDVVETECDLNERKRRDAEVLCTLAANAQGNVLELGTSHGRGAFKLATNLKNRWRVFTVNMLPEQLSAESGELLTHLLTREQIGSFYRPFELKNIDQIFIDTSAWDMPPEINALSLVFVDAAHDTERVAADSRLVFDRIGDGGFICWHDFSPDARARFDWIDASMRGVEKFLTAHGLDGEVEIVHLRNSWTGVMRKPTGRRVIAPSFPRIEVTNKSPRILLGYSDYHYESSVRDANEAWLARMRAHSIDVTGTCLTLNPPGPCLTWKELDERWRRRDPQLLAHHEYLRQQICAGGYDTFVNFNGINLHPEFVRTLDCFTVYCCFDDPESSHALSRPVAAAYDLAMVGNIAELDAYRSWGCRQVEWLPMGFRSDEYNPALTEQGILTRQRPVEVCIVCERESPWRRERLDHFAKAFPQGRYHGKGWPTGFLNEKRKLALYQDARIGLNLHNSTGPINYRTFTIPANGALLLCDNSTRLGKIFSLGVEAIGYDYMDEAIAHAKFFLVHEPQRREIAAAGWRRAMRDYTEAACFRRILDAMEHAKTSRITICTRVATRPPIARDAGEAIEPLVRPGMNWLLAGSGDGLLAVQLMRQASDTGSGVICEPNPQRAAKLRELVHRQRRAGSVEIHETSDVSAAIVNRRGDGFDFVSAEFAVNARGLGRPLVFLPTADRVAIDDFASLGFRVYPAQNGTIAAWALPKELAAFAPDLQTLVAAMPQNYDQHAEIFASLSDVLLYRLAQRGAPVSLRIKPLGGQSLALRPGTADSTVLWDVFHFKFHAPPVPLRADAVVVDFGCNVGYTTAHLASLCPQGRVFAVELDEANYKQAQNNTAHLGGRCVVQRAAVWSSDGEISYGGTSTQGFHVAGGATTAPARCIDTLLREFGVREVDYLKMDIEGAEVDVFRASLGWLDKVRSLKVEVHKLEDFDWIKSLLEARGFQCAREKRHYCGIEAVRQ
jgi:spore maturation protein CgeB